jgi:hypothetical protein
MTERLGLNEPRINFWSVQSIDSIVSSFLEQRPADSTRPVILAIDGRGGSGKSTLAARISERVPSSAVVHTDDIAWHLAFFDWADHLVEGVLRPVHAGEAVSYRPPGWEAHDRTGAIDVPSGLDLLIIEGCGTSREVLQPWIDQSIWVQIDLDEGERRCMDRERNTLEARAFWDEWMREEIPFFEQDRPWERASLIVAGGSTVPHDPETELVIAKLHCP